MNTFTKTYAEVSESVAKRAKEMNSFSDYKQGTATATQHMYVDSIVEYAEKMLEKNPTEDREKLEKVQYYIDKYSVKVAQAIDKENQIRTRCPSILITGGSNFPVAKKEKQNRASDAHWQATKDLYKRDSDNYYYNKIRLTLTDSGAIKSDDVNAVDKIKAKIAKLETMPDPYGNKKAEIRRLKERLLILAPDEMKQGKEITINGIVATYENIIELFNSKSTPIQSGESYYLSIPLLFTDGARKYKEYISNQVDADCKNIYVYGQDVKWKPLDDRAKFYLIINRIHGSGNKAVIYSILKDLDPQVIAEKQAQAQAKENGEGTAKNGTINGEAVTVEENEEMTRLQIFFDGIPQAETRNLMKSNGFKWAPSQQAWQRLLNDNAKSALSRILEA